MSFTISGRHVSEIGMRLDEEHGVLSRVGLHCAPAAHRTIRTFPEGTVRLSPGVFTTDQEIEEALQAIARVVRS
jgi:selenocysteine lyase/cysteine desulfurase